MPPAPFVWTVRVYYEDTDAAGVVYHGDYLRFLERARTEWLRELGHSQSALREREGVIFAVSRVKLDLLRPARLDDLLEVSVALERRGRVSLDLSQAIMRGGEPLCRAGIRVACLDAERLRPRAIPAAILAELR